MRLFLYYSLHTTWNQLRKLFRTWLFLLVLCVMLGGGLIGLGAARFSSQLNDAAGAENPLPEHFMEFFDASGMNAADAAELGSGLMIIAIFSLQIITAEKSVSRLFLPADVNFLFASDMTPQQVLSFRVMSTLGTAMVASVYLFFQLPSLVRTFGISSFAAGMFLLMWCLTILYGMLLKILTYELSAGRPWLRRNLRFFVFGFLALVALGFWLSYRASEEQVFLLSAHRFFNAPWTRWIPVYGWLKGMFYYALIGNNSLACILAAAAAGLTLIIALILHHFPADYYEEALIRSEEVSLYMEAVNRENAGLLVLRPASRSDRISRETRISGEGPSVYFHKTLNVRRRFAFFGLISRTFLTYLFAAGAGGLFVRMFMDEPSPYPPVFILAVVVFFRTVASPMSEDIRRDSFTLIPENTWHKLGFSLLGGSVNCALDAAVPLMVSTALSGFQPLRGLLFLPLILSVDLFATTVGTFVDVAIPSSVDKSLKQVIQILLLYLGMIPDEMIIAFGFISGHGIAGMIAASCVNLFLGALFFGLAGVWLDPAPGRSPHSVTWNVSGREAEHAFSRIGLALAAMYTVIFLSQAVFAHAAVRLSDSSVLYTLATYLPIYLIGVPVFLFLTRSMQWQREEGKPLTLGQFSTALAISFCLMYAGSFLGFLTTGFLSRLIPFSFPSWIPVGELHPVLSPFFLTILSPLAEELVFRRCLIDRMRPYGEKIAVFGSAVLFALFHANFQQFFYAAFLGIVFGYIYLRTGRLRYSAALHMIINAMGSFIAPALLSLVLRSLPETGLREMGLLELLQIPQIALFVIYILFLVAVSLVGLVLLAYHAKHCRIRSDSVSPAVLFSSPGITGFVVYMVMMCLYSLHL